MQHINRWMVVILLILAALPLAACLETSAGDASKIEPAHVEPIAGTELSHVVLTEKAAERLAIQTAPVREEQVARTRVVGGEVMAMPAEGATTSVGSTNTAQAADRGAVLVRVALNESDLNQVDRNQPTRVLPLDGDSGATDVTAQAVEAPATDVAAETTMALYYAVDGTNHGLTPGQLVLVELPLLGGGMKKVIPYAAVIYDLHGETWTYTSPDPLVYVRHAITVDYIAGDLAILSEGPPVGTAVVTLGVIELWGAETGVGGKH